MCDIKEQIESCSQRKRCRFEYLEKKFTKDEVEEYLFGKNRNGTSSLFGSIETPEHDKDMPNIVRFCISTVPGAGYGIQAIQVIPEGAWIGPYNGKLVKPDEKSFDSSHAWEIFKDGVLQGYLDGTDQKVSGWMRFIGCARHKQEQNLYVFQYKGKIYYRVFKTIRPGQELLVWYDDKYSQYLGIPFQGIYDMSSSKAVIGSQERHALVGFPATPPTSPTTPPTGIKTVDSVHTVPQPSNSECLKSKERKADDMRVHTWSGHDNRIQSSDQNNGINSPTTHNDIPDEPEIQCGQCEKHFAQRSMLHTHICSKRTNRPYQCGHCDERFSSPVEMTSHVATHQDKKPFKCGYCSRSFTGATTLNNHVRMHSGNKPFECFRCGQRFSKGLQLSRHQREFANCGGLSVSKSQKVDEA